MTRAKERLIVSGAIDREKARTRRRRSAGCSTGSTRDEELAAAGDAPVEIERGDARLVVRVDRHRAAGRQPAEAGARAGRAGPARALRRARGGRAAAPRRRCCRRSSRRPSRRCTASRRLSFTALSTFEQCSYKYYARYVAGMRAPAESRAARAGERPARDGDRRRGAPAARAGRPRVAAGSIAREWYPTSATRSSSGSAPSSRRTATRSSRARRRS